MLGEGDVQLSDRQNWAFSTTTAVDGVNQYRSVQRGADMKMGPGALPMDRGAVRVGECVLGTQPPVIDRQNPV